MCSSDCNEKRITNVDNFQRILNEVDQHGKKHGANVLIITTVDDQEKILSCLKPTNAETVLVNLNEKNSNRRALSQSGSEISNEDSKNGNIKRRKADLTCVICGGSATGYNFNQITCESCKAFFRRNALQPIEKTKCLNHKNTLNEVRCDIRYDVKHKCQRCRLLKCFESGMRKDHILTAEEKLSKQQRLEENRRIRSTQISNNDMNMEPIAESSQLTTSCEPLIDIPPTPSDQLTEADWFCLHHIQSAYLSASQSSPSASSVLSLELAADRMSIYMNTLEIQNYAAVKLINFIRQIPEFEEIDESDRLILVKHNLTLLLVIRHALAFDTTRELIYEDNLSSSISPSDEAFAQHCKSLYILCYGYEFNREFILILRSVYNIVEKDPIVVQLLMLTMVFLKGLAISDDQQPLLNDGKHVFQIHLKYTDLLFRYFIYRSSFDAAVLKMVRITEVLIKSQRLMRDFHQYVKNKVDANSVNPLMRSLLNLT